MFEEMKCITLSTYHITPGAIKILNENIYCPDTSIVPFCIYKKDDYGYFLYPEAKEDLCENREPDNPDTKCLFDLWKFAHENSAGLICLDCDGPVVPDLPHFERLWE